MKYKDRKNAKRKYKQALLATVATMTLGVSTLGSPPPAFADKFADVSKATSGILGKFINSEDKKNKEPYTKIAEKISLLTGTGVQAAYKELETGKTDEISRDIVLGIAAAIPYGGAYASLILGALIPEKETTSLEAKLKAVREEAKAHTVNLINTHLTTLQNKLESFERNVNPGQKDGTYYSLSPEDSHGELAKTINDDFLSLINECQTEGLQKELLPIYTAATSAHLLFLQFMEKNKQGNPNISMSTQIYNETFVTDSRMQDLRKKYITYMKKTYDLHIDDMKELLKGTSVNYDENPNVVLKKLDERDAQLVTNIALSDSLSKRSELDTVRKAKTEYQAANKYATRTIYNAAFTQAANWHWVKDINDNWYYYDDDNNQKTGWVKDDYSGSWYYFNPETNKQNSKNESFAKGQMMTGWVDIKGKWYYLSPANGTQNTEKESFAKGAAMTGWVNSDGSWYYLNPTQGAKNDTNTSLEQGEMVTGLVELKGEYYYLSPENGTQSYTDSTKKTIKNTFKKGAAMTDFVDIKGKWYYLSPENGTQNYEKESFKQGEMVVGWVYFGNDMRYFSTYPNNTKPGLVYGQMVTGDATLHPHETKKTATGSLKNYHFDANGIWDK